MAKVPVTVVTGFLGSGKTSLLRHLVAHAGGRRIALVINEFGELGIDRELLLGCGIAGCGEEEIVELANGCICCTVADDFLPTMRRLLGRDPRPDHILIETSGLALPKPLVQAFAWPEVRTRATVDGVVAVVDAEAVAAGLFAPDPAALERMRRADPSLDHETPLEELFEEQIVCADLVLLNKLDRVDEEGRRRAEEAVARHLRPGVPVLPAAFARVDPGVLLDLGAGAEEDLDNRPSHIDLEGEHDHDDFASCVLAFGEVPDRARLLALLEALPQSETIYRIKGFAAIAGKPARLVVQGVGARIETHFDRPFRPGESRRTRLVVIGPRELDRKRLEALLRDHLGAVCAAGADDPVSG